MYAAELADGKFWGVEHDMRELVGFWADCTPTACFCTCYIDCTGSIALVIAQKSKCLVTCRASEVPAWQNQQMVLMNFASTTSTLQELL